MSSSHRSTSKPQSTTAPDILGKSQNWVQKVSSIRLSNIRVGQHLTNLLGDSKDANVQHKTAPNEVFHPSFCKLLKITNGGSLVFVGGKTGVRIWLTSSSSHSHTECSTDLLYTSGDNEKSVCVDLCFSESVNHSSSGDVMVYLLLNDDNRRHRIRPLVIRGDFSSSSAQLPSIVPLASPDNPILDGTANAITCTKRFLLISQTSTGTVNLWSRQILRQVGTIPSLGPRRPVVIAASSRWIAIQTSQESVTGTHIGQQGNQRCSDKRVSGSHRSSTNGGGHVSSVPDVGEAARKVVSGLYSLSQVVSWQVVSPIINAAVQHGQGQKAKPEGVTSERSENEKSEDVVGGAVLVMDLGHTQSQEDIHGVTESCGNIDVAVRAHFAAHATTLGFMAFSPTGLKLASADCLGQVVLVHSLAPSGLLSRAHPVISPTGLHYCGDDDTNAPPQLLFKLVRGLSLSSIIDIGFSADETIVFGSTVNGTVHIFDLDQLSALDSGSRGNSHGSSLASHSSFKSGSSLTSGGYGSLEHTSSLLSPPTSSSHVSGPVVGSLGSHTNSSLLTMSAGAVTDSAFQQYGIPSADVSQFLSLHRPDLRVLQGYSDIRVKLPLSETFYQHQQLEQQQLNHDGSIHGREQSNVEALGEYSTADGVPDHVSGSSYYPQEVNLRSSSILYANPAATGAGGGVGQGLESDGSYELLVGTSEGLLSRYRLTFNSYSSAQQAGGGGVTSVLSNLMPSHSQTAKELNRWVLCESLTSYGKVQNSEPIYRQPNSKHNVNVNSTGEQHGSSNYSTWLYAASDVDEPLATPLWIRPQVKLFTLEDSVIDVHKDINGSSNHSVHDNKGGNGDTQPFDEWLEDKGDNGELVLITASKKKKKKSKQQQPLQSQSQSQPAVLNSDEIIVSNSHLKEDTSTASSSSHSINGGRVSKNTLFFPERQTSKHLYISRPSTFVYGSATMQHGVGTGNTPKLDTGVILEEYIQTALGDSYSDARHGSTPIAISMIKHSRPPEDISAWHMDDDWGNDDDQEPDNGFESGRGVDIKTQSDC